MSGWWKAPRSLVRTLRLRELTPSAWMVLVYLGLSGADRKDGLVVTRAELVESLELSLSTVSRALRNLRAEGWISYADHPGQASFVVRLERGEPGSRAGSPAGSPAGSREGGLVTEVGSVTTSVMDEVGDASEAAPEAVSGGEGPSVTTSVTLARARDTETETETENPPGSPLAGGMGEKENLSSDLRPGANRRRRSRLTNERVHELAAERAKKAAEREDEA